jgi:hypothetical protein
MAVIELKTDGFVKLNAEPSWGVMGFIMECATIEKYKQDDIEKGKREIAEGKRLIEESERQFRENFPELDIKADK